MFSHKSSVSSYSCPVKQPPINITVVNGTPALIHLPDASNFTIVKHERVGGFLLVEVFYPDCKNYEGRKILVFDSDFEIDEIVRENGGVLDPHFFDHKDFISPIARFEPTNRGWNMARWMFTDYIGG